MYLPNKTKKAYACTHGMRVWHVRGHISWRTCVLCARARWVMWQSRKHRCSILHSAFITESKEHLFSEYTHAQMHVVVCMCVCLLPIHGMSPCRDIFKKSGLDYWLARRFTFCVSACVVFSELIVRHNTGISSWVGICSSPVPNGPQARTLVLCCRTDQLWSLQRPKGLLVWLLSSFPQVLMGGSSISIQWA